jgi:hypothetical protein
MPCMLPSFGIWTSRGYPLTCVVTGRTSAIPTRRLQAAGDTPRVQLSHPLQPWHGCSHQLFAPGVPFEPASPSAARWMRLLAWFLLHPWLRARNVGFQRA